MRFFLLLSLSLSEIGSRVSTDEESSNEESSNEESSNEESLNEELRMKKQRSAAEGKANEDYLCLPNPGRKSNLHSSFFILNSSFLIVFPSGRRTLFLSRIDDDDDYS